MTKQIRIPEDTHTKLKIYVAKKKMNIVEFADKAIKDAIELDRIRELLSWIESGKRTKKQ